MGSSTDLITQHVEYVNPNDKRSNLMDLLHSVPGLTLVFVETKRGADSLQVLPAPPSPFRPLPS